MAKNRKTPDMNLPMWFDGQNINEALFCEEFLQERRIIFANGAFFTPDGRVTDDLPLRGEIYEKLKFCAVNNIPRKITNILEVLKLEAQEPDFPPEQDRIHVANGTLMLNGTFTEGKPAIVLDAEKTTPYEFYQYWRNVSDQDVIKCLKLLTFVPIEQIEEMERTLEGQQLNQAKELLAYSLTELVHGKEAADQAQDAAKAIFTSGSSSENMPTTAIPAADLQDGGIGILTLMVKAGLCASNGEARRLVQQGGVSVNNEKITDPKAIITLDGETIIKKGKKVFHKVVVE